MTLPEVAFFPIVPAYINTYIRSPYDILKETNARCKEMEDEAGILECQRIKGMCE